MALTRLLAFTTIKDLIKIFDFFRRKKNKLIFAGYDTTLC